MSKPIKPSRRTFLAGAAALAPLSALAALPAHAADDAFDRHVDQLWHDRRDAWIRCDEAMAIDDSDHMLDTMNRAINDINDKIAALPVTGGTPTLAAAHLMLALYTMTSVPAESVEYGESGVAGILAALAVLAPMATGLVGKHAAFIVANPDLRLDTEIYRG